MARSCMSAFCLLLWSLALSGQQNQATYNLEVQHWGVEEGLSHRRVESIFQDSRGFIWVGTANGLNRFDGHQFQTFTKERGLAGNEIHYLFEDAEGWLWVSSAPNTQDNQTLAFIHVKTNEVLSVEERFGEKFPFDPQNFISALTKSDGSIYLTAGTELFQYKDEQFSLIKTFGNPFILNGFDNDRQTLLGHIKAPNGIIELIELKGTEVLSREPFQSLINVFYAFYDYEGNCWVRIDRDLQLRERGQKDFKPVSWEKLLDESRIEPDFEKYLIPYKPGEYVFFDKEFLFVLRPGSKFRLDIGKLHPEVFKAHVLGVFIDRQQNLWFATEFGVYRVKLEESPFTNYLNSPLDEYNAQTTFSTLGISATDDELWVNGLNQDQFLINLKDGSKQEVSLKGVYADPNASVDPIVLYPILKTGQNEFLTADLNLVRYKNGKVVKAYRWKPGEGFDKSWSIYEDEDQIWLGLYDGGLGIVEKGKIVRFKAYNEFELLAGSQTYRFLKWNDAHTLLATTTGIYVLNDEKGIVQRFWSGADESQRIPFDKIYHINKDPEDPNLLWVASAGGGLFKLQLAQDGLSIQSVEQFTEAEGLSNNVLYAVYPDDHGQLWLPSDYGLMRFDRNSNAVSGFTTSDGLPWNEFNRIAHYQAENGQLFLGTMNGVTTFHPRDFLNVSDAFDAPLQITAFKQFSGETNALEDRTAELLVNGNIVLEPDDNLLILNFALLEYEEASRIKYSYQLKGQSDDWVYLNSSELRLSGLAYGKYTLNIRAQGSSGEFSTQRLSIPVLAKSPFYMQWWFITLSLLMFFLSVYLLFRYRTKSLRKRQRELVQQVQKRTEKIEKDKQVIATQANELKSLDELKSRFFANVSHELRTPLTLIVAPVQEILAKQNLDEDLKTSLNLVSKNSRRLQGMVNEILDLSKFEAGKMTIHKASVNWYGFLNQLYTTFDSLAMSQKVDYSLTFEGSKEAAVRIDKSKVETVFNNLLSNAFKFTSAQGSVSVLAGIDQNHIWLHVNDTGRGISKEDLPHIFDRYFQTKDSKQAAQGGTGIGLALTRELVKLMEGEITVESVPRQQTTFRVQFPAEVLVAQVAEIPEPGLSLAAATFDDEPSIEQAVAIHGQGDTILLVEDNPDLRLFVSGILEEYYSVVTAAHGQEALEMLAAHADIKLIVSDIMMPIMDGFQLLDKLKSTADYKNLPVIMLTARAELQDKLKALRIGVDDYLTKPFIKEELLARIDNLLQNARGREEARLFEPVAKESPLAVEEEDAEIKAWLDKLEAVVLKNIELSEFGIDDIADEMATSKRQLYRFIKEHIGLTPLQYLKDFKLNYARQLLEEKKVNAVKVAAYSIGYPNVVYFRREFKKAFGRLPSDYLE
ncbi:MAG: response regulator [Roseivirga sp.]|nr:response regulator [Roseivirga sp.]